MKTNCHDRIVLKLSSKCITVCYSDIGEAVQMLGVKVPAYIFMGDSVQLFCDYDMQMDKLYSVTWYKDNEEFYRYVPTSKHLKHSYRMDGITVDVSTSYYVNIRTFKV